MLLATDKGIGRWQEIEYDSAFDKHVNTPDFPVVLMLLEGQAAPRLSFLKQLRQTPPRRLVPQPTRHARDRSAGSLHLFDAPLAQQLGQLGECSPRSAGPRPTRSPAAPCSRPCGSIV